MPTDFTFTLSIQPPTWTPAALVSPGGWFRSNIGVTQVGNAVSAWADQSSAGNNLTQQDSTHAAYIVDGFVNSFTALTGLTIMRNISLTSSIDRASFSGGLVVNPHGSETILIGFGGSAGTFGIQKGVSPGYGGNFQHLFAWDGANYINTSITSLGRKMWVSWRNNSSALEIWSNLGHYIGTKLTTATLTSLYMGYMIDLISPQAGSPGRFKEIVVSRAALSDSEQTNLNYYLTNKALGLA